MNTALKQSMAVSLQLVVAYAAAFAAILWSFKPSPGPSANESVQAAFQTGRQTLVPYAHHAGFVEEQLEYTRPV